MADNHLDFEQTAVELMKQINIIKDDESSKKTEQLKILSQELEMELKRIQQNLTPWQRVKLARHPMRPYAMDYFNAIFSDFMELSGDRKFHDDMALIGGFAKLNDKPVMLIGTQKGRDTKDNLNRNFGWPNPEGYRKAMRLADLAVKADVPLITFIDTPGAFPGVTSEERHIAEAIANNLQKWFALPIPIISIVIGEGGSGGALGISVCNKLLILENAYFSVITPEGCAAILWKDRSYSPEAADALKLTADNLLKLNIADEVIPEPPGGAHWNYQYMMTTLKKSIENNLHKLNDLSKDELLNQRYEKFRKIGVITKNIDKVQVDK